MSLCGKISILVPSSCEHMWINVDSNTQSATETAGNHQKPWMKNTDPVFTGAGTVTGSVFACLPGD